MGLLSGPGSPARRPARVVGDASRGSLHLGERAPSERHDGGAHVAGAEDVDYFGLRPAPDREAGINARLAGGGLTAGWNMVYRGLHLARSAPDLGRPAPKAKGGPRSFWGLDFRRLPVLYAVSRLRRDLFRPSHLRGAACSRLGVELASINTQAPGHLKAPSRRYPRSLRHGLSKTRVFPLVHTLAL